MAHRHASGARDVAGTIGDRGKCGTHRAMLVKKYSNRRLYDTESSRYITLDELAEKIRAGSDAIVLDAKTNEDLTQATLTQIILEHRAHLLPVPLLTKLVRLHDDALAEFFGRYMSWALELYLQARQGAQSVSPYVPMANLPFQASNMLARLLLGSATPWSYSSSAGPSPASAPPPAPAPAGPPSGAPAAAAPAPPGTAAATAPAAAQIEELRRELDELKRAIKKTRRR